MPNLSAFAASASAFGLKSTIFAGSVYTTLYTGQPVQAHGIHGAYQWIAGEQRTVSLFRLPRPQSIFHQLARRGARVILLDPSESPVPELPGGSALSGIQFRSRVLMHRWHTPDAFARKVLRDVGFGPGCDETFGEQSRARQLRTRDVLLKAPARLVRAAACVLSGGAPDLFWATLSCAHTGGHQLFDPGIPASPDYPTPDLPDAGFAVPPALCELYETVDRALGDLLGQAPAGADVLVFFGKGMGPSCSRADLLGRMIDLILGQGEQKNRTGWADRLRSGIPPDLRERLTAWIPDYAAVDLTARLESPRAEWSRTRAFPVPTDQPGFIRFNLRGRERYGIVDGHETADLAAALERGLMTFFDIDESGLTANRSASCCWRRDDRIPAGPRRGDLPDLVVEWNPSIPAGLRGVHSTEFGTVLRTGAGTGRSGNHCPGTRAWLRPAGGRNLADAGSKPLAAIPATICELLGVPEIVPGSERISLAFPG
ncbi:MAG: hypothetical protein ACK5AZ_18170 [Bryobacteraceae bacterium]